jgi:Na+-driven multidrug efflux pump
VGKSKKALYLTLTRQFLFFLPCLLIFPFIWGELGIWLSIPASDILASLNAGYLLFREFRNNKIRMPKIVVAKPAYN